MRKRICTVGKLIITMFYYFISFETILKHLII